MTMLNTAALPTAKRYRIAREVAGLSQGELATIVGVNRTTVGDWEAGRTEPAFSKLVALANATEQPLDWFAEGLFVDVRARRDSNPQPSDWEFGQARRVAPFWTADRKLSLLTLECQLDVDAVALIEADVA